MLSPIRRAASHALWWLAHQVDPTSSGRTPDDPSDPNSWEDSDIAAGDPYEEPDRCET